AGADPPLTTTTPTPVRPQRADARRNCAAVIESARKQFAARGLDAQIEALAQTRFERLAEAGRAALEADDGWEGFVEFMTYSARVMAEDRLLSEAMDEHGQMCGKAAESVGLMDITTALV